MADYDVGKAFRRIENELISSMISNLQNHRAQETAEGIQWSQWQAKQLQALDAYKRQNKEKFSGKFAAINENISEAIQEAYNTGGMDQEMKILKAIKKGYTGSKRKFNGATNTEGGFFKVNERKLNALINSTTHDMQEAESAVLRMANDKYRKIIFDAQVYANAGGTTYEKAVDMATRDFLAAGLNCVEYKNGARHTISDYADMAVRTANKRAYLRGEGTKRAEWGIHTVIVNKRGNACPLCLPFVEMVLIDDVYSGGSSEDGDYTLLSSAMARGFLHPRCEDNYTTYFEGISTPPKEQKLSRADIEDVEEKQKQEQQKQYAENQAQRMDRLAKYSLDEDNQKMYSARAEQWRDRAEMLSEKPQKSVAKSADSGIIKSLDVDDYELAIYGKDIANEVNAQIIKSVQNCEREGDFIISEVSAKSIPATSSGTPVLQIEPLSNGLLRLNLNTDKLAGKTLQEIDRMFSGSDISVVNSLEEAMIHESGHAKSIFGKKIDEIRVFYDELKNVHVEGISDIAYMDGAEALAELEVLRFRGVDVPQELIEFYEKYMGRGFK